MIKQKNVDKDLCAFFRKFDEVESFISKLENTIEKYRNKNKESFIIINSISTVSKTKILKPINECDPLNFLKVGDDILNRIDVAIIDKLTNSTSVDR